MGTVGIGIRDIDEAKPFLLMLIGNDIFNGSGVKLPLEDGIHDGIMVPEKGILL